MIVALDIDGTITRCPKFFALLSHTLVSSGNEVLIVTFRPDPFDEIAADLKQMGIAYTDLITNLNLDMSNFARWKASVCKQRKVDIFFEDMPEVAAAVEPPTVVMVPLDDRTRGHLALLEWEG